MGKQPIHHAAIFGNGEIVASLIEKCGVNPHEKSEVNNCEIVYNYTHQD